MKVIKPFKGTWAFIFAFTTLTNYSDKEKDSLFLKEVEKNSLTKGCIDIVVPLSKKHPYE